MNHEIILGWIVVLFCVLVAFGMPLVCNEGCLAQGSI